MDNGGSDLYVRATGLSDQGPLIEEERVSFETELDSQTNGPNAVNVVRVGGEAPTDTTTVEEEPAVESVVEKFMQIVMEELKEDELTQKSLKTETFQRARLGLQVEQIKKDAMVAATKANDEAAALEAEAVDQAAEEAAAREALLIEAQAEVDAVELAEAEARERVQAEDEALAVKADAEAKAAVEATAGKDKADAEAKAVLEAAAAAAAKDKANAAAEAATAQAKENDKADVEAKDDIARELDDLSVAIANARRQPKSLEEEAVLAAKYGAMDLEQMAFTILVDLGMVDLNIDPDDPNRDTSKDDEDI